MIDLKLTEKASIVLALVAGTLVLLVVAAVFTVSYKREENFVIAGKEFGFGNGALQKQTAELTSTKEELAAALKKVAQVQSENRQLREVNQTLTAQVQNAASHASSLWFPVDDVTFNDDGTYSTDTRREGRGKWENKDSELSLKLLSHTSVEVVLGTNLPPPGNKLRIPYKGSILIPMNKWEYSVLLKDTHENSVELRIERRGRT